MRIEDVEEMWRSLRLPLGRRMVKVIVRGDDGGIGQRVVGGCEVDVGADWGGAGERFMVCWCRSFDCCLGCWHGRRRAEDALDAF